MIEQLNFLHSFSVREFLKEDYDAFEEMFLGDLITYRAYAKIVDDKITAIVCVNLSRETPQCSIMKEYYSNIQDLKEIVDSMFNDISKHGYIEFNRANPVDEADPYDSVFDEKWNYAIDYVVPSKRKCLYGRAFHYLFNHQLLDKDTAVKTAVLKKEFRTIPLVGNI